MYIVGAWGCLDQWERGKGRDGEYEIYLCEMGNNTRMREVEKRRKRQTGRQR